MNETPNPSTQSWLIPALAISLLLNFISLVFFSAHVLAAEMDRMDIPAKTAVETRAEDAFSVPLPAPMPVFAPF